MDNSVVSFSSNVNKVSDFEKVDFKSLLDKHCNLLAKEPFRLHAQKVLFVRESSAKFYSLAAMKLFLKVFIGDKQVNFFIGEAKNEFEGVKKLYSVVFVENTDTSIKFNTTKHFSCLLDNDTNSSVYTFIQGRESNMYCIFLKYFTNLSSTPNFFEKVKHLVPNLSVIANRDNRNYNSDSSANQSVNQSILSHTDFKSPLVKKRNVSKEDMIESNILKLTTSAEILIMTGVIGAQSVVGIQKAQEAIAGIILAKIDTRIDMQFGDSIPNFWSCTFLFLNPNIKKRHIWIHGPANRGKTYFAQNLIKKYQAASFSPRQKSTNEITLRTQIIILDEVEKGNAPSKADIDLMCDGDYKYKILYQNEFPLKTGALVIVLSNKSIDEVYEHIEQPYIHARFGCLNVTLNREYESNKIMLNGSSINVKAIYGPNDLVPDLVGLKASFKDMNIEASILSLPYHQIIKNNLETYLKPMLLTQLGTYDLEYVNQIDKMVKDSVSVFDQELCHKRIINKNPNAIMNSLQAIVAKEGEEIDWDKESKITLITPPKKLRKVIGDQSVISFIKNKRERDYEESIEPIMIVKKNEKEMFRVVKGNKISPANSSSSKPNNIFDIGEQHLPEIRDNPYKEQKLLEFIKTIVGNEDYDGSDDSLEEETVLKRMENPKKDKHFSPAMLDFTDPEDSDPNNQYFKKLDKIEVKAAKKKKRTGVSKYLDEFAIEDKDAVESNSNSKSTRNLRHKKK